MSNFICEHCGAECLDSPEGYTTGCAHYPADVPAPFALTGCNFTCARASTCHEYEDCDGVSHFLAKDKA